MAKKSARHIPKKLLVKNGLIRVGKWPNLKWSFMGKPFDTLRQVWNYYLTTLSETP